MQKPIAWRTYLHSASLHEAAHAVLAVVAGHRIREVALVETGEWFGHVAHDLPADTASDPVRVLDLLAITAAGARAERLWGRLPREVIDRGARADEVELASLLALAPEAQRATIRTLVDRRTADVLAAHRAAIHDVARALRRRRRLRFGDVLAAMGRGPAQLSLPFGG